MDVLQVVSQGFEALAARLRRLEVQESSGALLQQLTNGGFEVWQRGGGPFSAHLAFSADGWYIELGTSSSMQVSKSAIVTPGSEFAASIVYTHAGNNSYLVQEVESYKQYQGRALGLSVKVRTNVVGGAWVEIDDGVTRTQSPAHLGSNAYETLSLSHTVDSLATKVHVRLALHASGTYYIDNAMLVVAPGSVDYVPMHPALDDIMCKRYYP